MIISHCKSGRIDNVVFDALKGIQSEIPIVVVTRLDDYVFNDDLLNLDRYIIANYCEFDWNFPWGTTPIFGKNAEQFRDKFPGEEWGKFIEFVNSRSPILTFQRELLKKDVSKRVIPIDYPATNEIPPIETREQFENRPIEVFYNWGLSNPMRPKLQGEIWLGSNKYGYSVLDNLPNINLYLKNEPGRRWLSVNTQWYSRFEMKDVLAVQGLSKLSVALFGSGRKCFRMTEASVNSVMVLPEDNFAWTFEWVDGFNCIKFQTDDWVGELNTYSTSDIYDIYKRGVETCRKYHTSNYKNYVEKTIKENG